jgi:hypothetical protein
MFSRLVEIGLDLCKQIYFSRVSLVCYYCAYIKQNETTLSH